MPNTAADLLVAEKHRLESGATLIYRHVPGAPRLAMGFFVPGGNCLDEIPGAADVIDRLLMKGTRTRDAEAIAVEIDGLTLEFDTDTRRDYSVMFATLLEEDLEPSLELMSDCFFSSTLDEFEREKEKMAGEIRMELDSPKARASDLFIRTMFDDTAYSVVGSVIEESLPLMDNVEHLRAHYRRVYRPDRLVIVAAGDVKLERLTSLLEQYFGDDLPGAATGAASRLLLKNLNHKESKIVTFARDDSNQAHIFKGWLAPDAAHDDFYPLAVLNTVLGGAGLSSRLFVELRDKQGLAYNVRSAYESYHYRGMFSMYIGTEPSNVQKCLKGFEEECQKLIDAPISQQELEETKRNILGRRSVFLETASQQASYLGTNYILGRSLEQIAAMPDRIRAVTVEDLQRVAQTYFTQPPVIAIVGPSACLI
jgi:predicted Zn-dependent peptidase